MHVAIVVSGTWARYVYGLYLYNIVIDVKLIYLKFPSVARGDFKGETS